MEYSDRVDLRKKTLSDQFNFVKQKTTNSSVMQYGNWRMGALFLSEFQGAHDTKPIVVPERLCHPVKSRDIPIEILRHELQRASSPEAVLPIFDKLRAIHRKRTYLDNKVHEIATIISKSNEEITKALLAKNQPLNNFACFEHIVENFNNRCFSLSENPYALGSLRVLANMCEGDFGAENIIDAMSTACRFIDAKNIV